MCTGGEILAVGAALGGTYLQQEAAADTAKQQQKIINAGADENSRLQSKKADTITGFAENTFDPTTREQRYEDAASKNESSLKDALLSASGGEGKIYTGTEGNLSSDYGRSKAAATSSASQDILNRAKLLSRSNATGLMYNDESLKGGTLASDLLGINAAGSRNGSATQAGVGSVRNNGSVLGGILTGGAAGIGKAYDKKYNSQ
ncbi:hypothetical protein ACFQ2T_04885 [Methylophilus flavus]|uniref:Uncharacterized protein n=1 Tax=Methylophilus flavus TaxID=640084 RepID=A0ABW3PBN4_9PROT